MNRKIKGFIDPLTLGFIIALLGGGTAITVHGDKQSRQNENVAVTEVQPSSATTVVASEETTLYYDED